LESLALKWKMPLTPKFRISQTDEYVLVSISVPHIRVSSAEIVTDGCDFSFYCKPYLLKLTFPHEFDEDEEKNKALYDPNDSNGTLSVNLQKKVPGQHFPNLDLTTKLLQVSGEREYKAAVGKSSNLNGIEVLESHTFDEKDLEDDDNKDVGLNDHDEDIIHLLGSTSHSYGFNSIYSNVLRNLREELCEMMEISDPDSTSPMQRRVNRIMTENALFNRDRYLGDFFYGEHDPIFVEAMKFKPFWVVQWHLYKELEKAAKKRMNAPPPTSGNSSSADTVVHGEEEQNRSANSSTNNSNGSSSVNNGETNVGFSFDRLSALEQSFSTGEGFSATEQEVLASALKHREIFLEQGSRREKTVLLNLVDILFAYCYDCRLNQGESNVESAYTIARLSCSFSWLDTFSRAEDDVETVLKYSLRRSLIYPYLRSWRFARKVMTDVAKVLYLGRRCVLKVLLSIRAVFEHTDTHYLLNKLFIDDYCLWLQGCASDTRVTPSSTSDRDLDASPTSITVGIDTNAGITGRGRGREREAGPTDEALHRLAGDFNAAKTRIEKEQEGRSQDKSEVYGKQLLGLYLTEIERWAVAQEGGGSDGDEDDVSDEESDTDSDGDSNSEESSDCEEEMGQREKLDIGSNSTTGPSIAVIDTETQEHKVQKDQVGIVTEVEAIPARFRDYIALHRSSPVFGYLCMDQDPAKDMGLDNLDIGVEKGLTLSELPGVKGLYQPQGQGLGSMKTGPLIEEVMPVEREGAGLDFSAT
jgi:protein SHQ1